MLMLVMLLGMIKRLHATPVLEKDHAGGLLSGGNPVDYEDLGRADALLSHVC